MKCPNHPRSEATGYCSVCGAFGCQDCLHEHEGNVLCRKHYRPVAQKIEEQKRHDAVRKRHARQLLVVRYKENRRDRGVCYGLNTQDEGFHLDHVDEAGVPLGKSSFVRFADLKAVFNVKSFNGKFDKSAVYREWRPEGAEQVVKFEDGEVIQGFTLRRYRGNEPRFYLIPKDPATNNVSILVEASAVAGIYTPEEYEAQRVRLREEHRAKEKEEDVAADLSREETMGDFYFETRNYAAAFEQYELAARQHPKSRRIQKKMLVTKYDIGVQHIKRRHYEKALACMADVLKTDPNNRHAMKKTKQLRRIIEKTKHAEA